jgi:large conductance mechanosensitive channel
MIKEFKDFINKGDIVTLAVAFVMAVTFKTIIDAILEGVINPIVAALAGESNFADIGFDIGDASISIGLVIAAILNFIIVALILFLIVKAYNKMKAADGPAGPTEVELLTEIRDQLKAR